MKKDFLIFGVSIFMGLLAMQSCEVEGCTDSDATNYDADATSDDGSCDYIHGCTDAEADNYNPAARIDDGSCEYFGCTDESATNYDPDATVDDGSCEYIYGCMDPDAINYNPAATIDDGSCEYYGCTDENAINYDPDATVDDGSCEYIYGCTDPDAINYNPDATMDDGSCEYEGPGQAMWWINSDLGVGNINIYFRGYYQGQITHYYYTTPDCGANGCVTVSEENGTYSWSAEADDGYTTWSGTIDITGYDCSTMELTINKNGKGEAKLVPSGDGSAIPQPIAH